MSVVRRRGFANALWEAAMSKPDPPKPKKHEPPAHELGVDPHGDSPPPPPPMDVPPHGGPREYDFDAAEDSDAKP